MRSSAHLRRCAVKCWRRRYENNEQERRWWCFFFFFKVFSFAGSRKVSVFLPCSELCGARQVAVVVLKQPQQGVVFFHVGYARRDCNAWWYCPARRCRTRANQKTAGMWRVWGNREWEREKKRKKENAKKKNHAGSRDTHAKETKENDRARSGVTPRRATPPLEANNGSHESEATGRMLAWSNI